MDIESLLRNHRKTLVVAAETAVAAAGDLPEKTQLNRLVSICGEATCAEEIASYLRYQASRKNKLWPMVFADTVIAKIQPPLDALISDMRDATDADRDGARVAAWRLYAVFLVRAFTYASVATARPSKKGSDHERARR